MPSSTTGLVNETFGNVVNTVDGIAFGGGALPSTAISLGGFGGFNASFARQINFPTGVNPGATGADNVLAVFSIPANAFDGLTSLTIQRGLQIEAMLTLAANTNVKTIKIIFNATTAVVGTTVTGGTTIASSGALATATQTSLSIKAAVYKTGAPGSNTQVGYSVGITVPVQTTAGTTPMTAPTAIAAVENAPILIAITGNAATTATDIALNIAEITGLN